MGTPQPPAALGQVEHVLELPTNLREVYCHYTPPTGVPELVPGGVEARGEEVPAAGAQRLVVELHPHLGARNIIINIPYGQSSATLPGIRSFGSFGSFGSSGSSG